MNDDEIPQPQQPPQPRQPQQGAGAGVVAGAGGVDRSNCRSHRNNDGRSSAAATSSSSVMSGLMPAAAAAAVGDDDEAEAGAGADAPAAAAADEQCHCRSTAACSARISAFFRKSLNEFRQTHSLGDRDIDGSLVFLGEEDDGEEDYDDDDFLFDRNDGRGHGVGSSLGGGGGGSGGSHRPSSPKNHNPPKKSRIFASILPSFAGGGGASNGSGSGSHRKKSAKRILEESRESARRRSELRQRKHELVEMAFNLIDYDKDGYLTSDELFIFFQQAAVHSGLKDLDDEIIHCAVAALVEDIIRVSMATAGTGTAGSGGVRGAGGAVSGVVGASSIASAQSRDASAATGGSVSSGGGVRITKQQFFDMFARHPDLYRAFETDEGVRQKRESLVKSIQTAPDVVKKYETTWNEQVWHRYKPRSWNARVERFWMLLYVVANAATFGHRFVEFQNDQAALAVFSNSVIWARAAAQCINLNCLLMLLPLCRHLSTWIQCTPFDRYFPFDAYLESHMMFGLVTLFFTLMHVCAHVCDFYRFCFYATEESIYALAGDKLGVVPLDPLGRLKVLLKSIPGVTGILMVVCMLIAYPTILVRRKKFNLFWTTHHLLIVMLIIMCVHGTANLLAHYQSVYWVIGPLSIYFLSRVFRETKLSDTQILLGQVKSAGIVHLQLKKPQGWKHVRAGMYAFLKFPQISQIEWHPFTLTSTPDDPYIEFHFAPVGDWTKSVQMHLQQKIAEAKAANGGEEGPIVGLASASSSALTSSKTSSPNKGGGGGTELKVKVDGPMGASSQAFVDFECVVLIGAGIGITPMISVLKYLLHHPGHMKKTYFYWTVRDYKSFEWFSQMMDEIYEQDANEQNGLEIYQFLTSLKFDNRDLGAILLNHARHCEHKRTNAGLLTKHRTKHQIEAGRPNMKQELRKIKSSARELGLANCGVFLCGPDGMAKALNRSIKEITAEDQDDGFQFTFTKETF